MPERGFFPEAAEEKSQGVLIAGHDDLKSRGARLAPRPVPAERGTIRGPRPTPFVLSACQRSRTSNLDQKIETAKGVVTLWEAAEFFALHSTDNPELRDASAVYHAAERSRSNGRAEAFGRR